MSSALPPRTDRPADQLRPVSFLPGILPHATGSVLVSFGQTRVLCSVTAQDNVPRWMKQQKVPGGWLTAEYAMLPASTHQRKDRDISRGKLDGRSSEIQRLIGRSLRAVLDLQALGPRTLWVDCDVLQADGGTRTAAITGSCVALSLALHRLFSEGKIASFPLREHVAAVSAGYLGDELRLDLDYQEDKAARVDFNLVMTESGQLVEIQGSGEESTFSPAESHALQSLAAQGIQRLCQQQTQQLQTLKSAPFDPFVRLHSADSAAEKP